MLSGFLTIEILITAIVLFGLSLIYVMRHPAKSWCFYPVFFGLLPLYSVIFGKVTEATSTQATFLKALLPVVALTTTIFVIWMIRLVIEKRHFEKGPLFYPLLFFVFVSALSLIAARKPESGLIILSGWIYLLLMYIAIYNTIHDTDTVKRFLFIYIGVCAALSLYGMFDFFIFRNSPGINPFRGVYEKNEYGFIMGQVFLLSFILSTNKQLGRSIRLFALASSLIFILGVILSFSRGCWVAVSAALAYSCLFLRPGRGTQIKLVAFSLVALLLGFVFFTSSPRLAHRLTSIWTHEHGGRKYPVMAALRAFVDHPVLGVGVDNYDEYYLFKYLPGGVEYGGMVGVPTVYLRALVETGIPGFIGLMWIIATIYRKLIKEIRGIQEDSLEKAMLVGFLLGFVANLVHFLTISWLWPIPWLYFWFAITLTKVVDKKKLLLNRPAYST